MFLFCINLSNENCISLFSVGCIRDTTENNILFLDLYDVAACNTILDCIVRCTPILIKRMPAAEEYLGENYPFYFEDLEEASAKIQDFEIIAKTNEYLKQMNKDHFQIDFFLNGFANSKIYQNLKDCKVFL